MSKHADCEEPGALARAVAWVAVGCSRHPWLVMLAVLATCAAALTVTWQRLEYQTQRTDLLNKRKDYYQRWQQYLAEFGDDDDLIVVVQGQDRARMRAALNELAEQIRAQPARFDRLFYRVDARPLRDRALLFLPADQIRLIQDNLKNMAMLLEPPVLGVLNANFGWQNLTVGQLLNEGQRRAHSLATDADGHPEHDPMLRQLTSICRSALATLRDPKAYRNPWTSIVPEAPQQDLLTEPHYFFSGDGALALLMVRPLKGDDEGFTLADKSIAALRTALRQLQPRYADLEFGLTGLPVLEHDEIVASRDDSNRASWLALIGVALLYLVVYRGLRYPLMTIVSLLVGTVWALGWLTLTVGHLNILSSAFAVMLIGMGDYGVLWVTRFSLERRSGELAEATRQTALHVGPSIVTAALTAAFAFYAAMLADLKAVAELGWIAGSGVLLCAASCVVVMPALLALFDRGVAAGPAIVPLAEERAARRSWLPGLMCRPRWVLGACALATIGLACSAWHIRYDHNILNMQDPNLDSVKWEHELLRHSSGDCWHAVTMTATPEEALALKARYEQLPGVSRVVEVASLVPRDQERKLELVRDIKQRLRRLPPRGTVIEHAEPALADIERAALKLAQALDRLDTTPLVGELRDQVRELTATLQSGEAGAMLAALQVFQKQMTTDLIEDLHRLRDVSTPAPIQVADIPECLRERYLGQSGKWLLRVFAKNNLWEFDALDRFVGDVKSADAEACGRPFATLEGLKAMRDGFLWAGLYALIAMVLVLLLDFGSVKHMIVSLLPLAMGMVASLGIMALCGVALNPANMIAFPLILGVGADNGVHVMHDYRDRKRHQRYALGHATGRGIMIAALTTILGFGTLMISQHRGLASLGLALTLGVTVCMLTALVFLPALLNVISDRRLRAAALRIESEMKHAA